MSRRADLARRLSAVSDALNRGLWASAAGFLVLMLGLVLLQIAARYLLRDAPPWTEEGARYAMVWGGLLGAVVSFHQDADPSLVQLKPDASRLLRRARAWARTLCVGVFAGVLLANSFGFIARAALRPTESLGWNLGLVVAILPLFAGLAIVQAVLQLAVFELTEEGADAEASS